MLVSNREGVAASHDAGLTVAEPGPGALDASFAGNRPPLGSIIAVALQSDGKLLIIDGGVRRLNPDGSSDHTFQRTTVESLGATITAIKLQGDGKIIVGGYQAFLWR